MGIDILSLDKKDLELVKHELTNEIDTLQIKKKSGQDMENYKERMALLWEEKEVVQDLIRNITRV